MACNSQPVGPLGSKGTTAAAIHLLAGTCKLLRKSPFSSSTGKGIRVMTLLRFAPSSSRLVRRGALAFGLAMGTAFVAGCSDSDPNRLPVVPVKGQLTFNGQPAAGAFVVFHPKAGADPRVVPARA